MSESRPRGKFLGASIVMVIFSVIYAISPWDFDIVPVVGWIDDAAVLLGSFSALLASLPRRRRRRELASGSDGE